MTIDRFRQGTVFRYAYRWRHQIGGVQNPKNRPACLMLKMLSDSGGFNYAIAAISDQEPGDPQLAMEVPIAELDRSGLSGHRKAFVHLSELNIDQTANSYTFHPNLTVMGQFGPQFLQQLSRKLSDNIKRKRTVLIYRQKD